MGRKWTMVLALCVALAGWAARADAGFADNGNGTVTDTSTGLTWQQASAPGTYTWADALAYCESLDLGGHTDWRLPTRKELRSLVDYSRYNPAINTDFFPDTQASWYWSSTTYADGTNDAWGVYFDNGYGDYDYKYSSSYVRAVRGGQSGSLVNLVIALDPPAGGEVTGPGIDCGNGNTDGQESLPLGTFVTLTARANDGYRFLYWYDDIDPYVSSNPYIFSLFSFCGDRHVRALFGKVPKITSPVTGYSPKDQDHSMPYVKNAQWQGQPPQAPNHGNYFNDYVIEGYYNNDQIYGQAKDNPCYWIVNGSGFGSCGKIEFSDDRIRVAKIIQPWTDTRIRFVPVVPYDFDSNKSVKMTVTKDDGAVSDPLTLPVIGIIKSRGYGQCTWYVAKTLMSQHKPIPPGAYDSTGAINVNYVPTQWDALTFSFSPGSHDHVAVIIGQVNRHDDQVSGGGTLITYTFQVGEMNADWGERESPFDGEFVVKIDARGKRSIVLNSMTRAKHLNGKGWPAARFYRTNIRPR